MTIIAGLALLLTGIIMAFLTIGGICIITFGREINFVPTTLFLGIVSAVTIYSAILIAGGVR